MTEPFYAAPNIRQLELPTEEIVTALLEEEQSSDLLFLLGNIYLRKGDIVQAIECFQNALQLAPEYTQIRCNLAYAYFLDDRTAEALTLLRPLTLSNPELSLAHLLLGNLLIKQGNTEGALQSFEKALRADPHCVEAMCLLGALLEEEKRSDEAYELYERALQIDPNYEPAQLRLGQRQFFRGIRALERGEVKEAITVWHQVFTTYPATFYKVREVAASYRRAVSSFGGEAGIKAALRRYEAAYQADPNAPSALYDLWLELLLALGLLPECYEEAPAEAKERWRGELTTFGEHPYPHFRLGVCACYEGRFEDARHELRWCQDHLPPKKQESLKIQSILDLIYAVEEVQRGVNNSRLSSAGLDAWQEAGFTDAFQQRVWKESGLEPGEAAEWRAAGVSPKQAREWSRAKVALSDAVLWQESGFLDADSARLWIRGGFAPDEAQRWQSDFPAPIEDTVQWRRVGFTDPKRAFEWSRVFTLAFTAAQWNDLGFEPLEALTWSEFGFKDPFLAESWRKRGFTAEAALQEFVLNGEQGPRIEEASVESESDEEPPDSDPQDAS